MKELLKRIFIVHKCVSCRKILDFKSFNNALCSDCREGYLGARMDICPECSLEAERCRCMTPLLKKDGALSLRKLFFYSKSKAGEPQNRLIYYLKRHKKASKRVLFYALIGFIYCKNIDYLCGVTFGYFATINYFDFLSNT